MKKVFNIIITGVGGQGLITLLNVLSQAAFDEGYDVKTSELHGLSQRGGSVGVHIRFGEKVWSPIIPQGAADLIIALEEQEALSGAVFASDKSSFLINEYETPTMLEDVSRDEIKKELEKISKNIDFISASQTCKKELGNDVVSGIYLLGCCIKKGLIPLKKESIIGAIKKTMPEKFWELNIKAFELC